MIEAILDDAEWESISAEWLEDIRLRLRELVHLIEKRRRNVVYTSFLDELGKLEEISLAGASNGHVDLARYPPWTFRNWNASCWKAVSVHEDLDRAAAEGSDSTSAR